MNEKRGYPNPNYTDEDFVSEPLEVKNEIMIDDAVVIALDKFEQLCSKAAALDILTAAIRATGKVDDDVARAVTGTFDDKKKTDADTYWDYYVSERSKNEKQAEEIAQLKRSNNELEEILRQNKIGPFADKAEEPKTEEES